jgi:hypothetical protein
MDVAQLIKDFGFPVVAAVGLGYFVFYVWKWSTTVVKPIIGEANSTLIALIDRIRMLDNDLIRLNQKLNLILEYQEKQRLRKMDYLEEEEEQKRERPKQNRKKTLGSD